jgi:DNA-binding response OmpR family regulator/anti-sigma regulatory factor (Ser/Thr protein kinase)
MNARNLVLVVDDRQVARDMMDALLAKEPYDLTFACDGYEALEKVQALTPDVVLLDIMMPGIDGFEVCRKLRANPRLGEIPIIMLTALDDRESRLQGIIAGADDFISKPFDRVELRTRLRTILRLNRYRRLLTERAWFDWVVERSDVGYVIVDETDRVVNANPQARLFLGLPPTETDTCPGRFWDLVSRQYRAEPADAWRGWPDAAALHPDEARYLVRPETSTSRAFWLRVTVLDQAKAPEAARLISLHDVTDEMIANRERQTFQTIMMHKVRTPLTAVRAGAELLDRLSISDPAGRETIEAIQQGVERLVKAVNDVIRYIKTSPRAAEHGTCPLGDMEGLVARLARETGLTEFDLTISQELLDQAAGLSRTAMEWILGELLENSVKFHPRAAPQVDISLRPAPPTSFRLRVQDDGLTLSPEQIARAWTPYYQGERYLTGNVAGMGLGLPTVASLVWEVGGQCRLWNREDGAGVIVELELPLSSQVLALGGG